MDGNNDDDGDGIQRSEILCLSLSSLLPNSAGICAG